MQPQSSGGTQVPFCCSRPWRGEHEQEDEVVREQVVVLFFHFFRAQRPQRGAGDQLHGLLPLGNGDSGLMCTAAGTPLSAAAII